MKRFPPLSTRRCPRCRRTSPNWEYVPHRTRADGKFTEQDYWRCPQCGAQSTGLDKRRTRVR